MEKGYIMEKKEIFDKIVSLIKPYVRNEESLANVSEETNFVKDLEINSTRIVDIVLALEDNFDVTIEDDEMESFSTIGEVVRMIENKK